jgi:hypothetical protein
MVELIGWKKDKYDERDYVFKPRAALVPANVNLLDMLPEVRNQFDVGACTGFSIGGNLTAIAKQQGFFEEWFSPTFIYNGARYLEGTLLKDVGAEPRNCLKWVQKSGALLEHLWPYDGWKLDSTVPSSSLIAQSLKFVTFNYYRITEGTYGIMSALANGHLVSLGCPWFDKWYAPAADGILPKVNKDDEILGGHATLLWGYDNDVLHGRNSWGREWGCKGNFAMRMSSLDVFKQLGGYDAYYIELSLSPQATPVTPAPQGCTCSQAVLSMVRTFNRAKRAVKYFKEGK